MLADNKEQRLCVITYDKRSIESLCCLEFSLHITNLLINNHLYVPKLVYTT